MKFVPLSKGRFFAVVDDADYDDISRFKWHVLRGKRGKPYAARTVQQKPHKTELMHRRLLSAGPGQMVDHKDGNGLNNSRSNIRLCTASQNSANAPSRRHSSKFRGVWRRGSSWVAFISISNKNRYLGTFKTDVEAAAAYDAAAIAVHGEFARLNLK